MPTKTKNSAEGLTSFVSEIEMEGKPTIGSVIGVFGRLYGYHQLALIELFVF